MHSSLARVVPLLLLLLLLAPTGPARAEGGGFAVAGAGNLVGSSGDARRGAARTFGLYATVGIDGRPRGVVSYVDRDARIRLRADSIEQLTVADGVATLVGSARVGGEEGQRFRLILRERRGGGAHHATIEISRPSQPAYRADADVGAGSLRITQRAVRPAPTPTRTPSSPAARARAGDAEVSHQPGASTRLTSQDGAVQLDVPPGAVVEAASFSQADLPTAQPNEQVRLAHTFRLDARTVQGRRPLTSFRKPLRLSVAYGDADLAALGTGPAGLKLFYQDASGAWIRLPAQVDQSSRRLTAAIDHFTVFALGTGDGFEAAGAGLGLSFLDDFASLSAWTARSGGGAVAANALTTTGAASTRDLYVLANAGAYTDLTFETQVADLAPAAGHRVGLAFRERLSAGQESYYLAYLSQGDLSLAKVINGAAPAPLGTTFVGAGSGPLWIKVVATGTALQVWTAADVGGAPGAYSQRISATDASLTAGTVGLLSDNPAGALRRGSFRGPKVTAALPPDWSGIVQTTGRPGVLWDRTAGAAHGGSGSLQLFSAGAANVGYAAQTLNNAVAPSTSLSVSGWIKAAGVSTASGDGARVVLVERDAAGTAVAATDLNAAVTGTSATWQLFSKTVTTRATTATLDVQVVLDGSGTANFDDIVVNASTPTPTPSMAATPPGALTSTSTPTSTPTPTLTSTPTPALAATPPGALTGIAYLNGNTVAVGGQTYLATNGGAPLGTSRVQQNVTGVLGRQNLVDASQRSIFVSTPVPGGQLWDISGSWRFNAWTRASTTDAGGFMRATIYRIDAAGVPSLVAVSPDALTNGFAGTTYTRSVWSADVPSGTILQPGERWGVEFQVDLTDTSATFGLAQMELGTAAHDSYALPALVALAPSPTPTLGGGSSSTPTRTSTPVPSFYLHAATTAVGSQSYYSVSTSGPTGTLATVTADLTVSGVQNFQDFATGRSIFVSSAVPAGTSWDLGGDWGLTTYTRANFGGATGYMRAVLYRVDAAGNAYLLATGAPDDANVLYATTWAPTDWTLSVPGGTTISAGERWGIQLQVAVAASAYSDQVDLGLDTVAQGSRVRPIVLARSWTATPSSTATASLAATPPGTPTAIPAYNLHAATTTVGGTTFRTIGPSAPANPASAPTMTASIAALGVDNYQDPATGQAIFVSGPNPSASASWDLGGTWTFTAYTSTSVPGGTGYLRARIHRIDASGGLSPLFTTGLSATNALLATTYGAQSWTAAVPSGTLIGPGERWGVELELDVTANRYNASSTLAYDTSALQSRVLPVVNTVAFTPGGPGTPSATPTRTPLTTSTATATRCSYACDDFNRGTAAGLGTATSGGVWQARPRDATSIGLCDSVACAATATGDGAYAFLSTGLVDHTAQVAIRQPAAGSGTAGLVIRARADWSRFLLAEVTRGGQIIVWRYDGGWTALGQSLVTLDGGQSDELSAVASGSTIAVRWNGVDQYSVQDTADAAGTYAGIYFGTYSIAGLRPMLDNFGVQATTVAPATPGPSVAPGSCGSATGASDFFNRTPPTGSLGCANGSGQAWTAPIDSAWTICGGNSACALAPAGGESWIALNANLSGQRVTAQLQPRSATAQGMAGIAARMSGFNSDMLWAGLDPSGQVDVWILASGAWRQATGAPLSTGYRANVARKLEIGVSGTLMSVYVDDARVFGPYDVGPAPAGATWAAMYAQASDGAAINWPLFDSFAVTAWP